MKRLPIVLTLVALIALAASVAYWILQLYQPPQRPLTAAPVTVVPEPAMDAAATLFGGQAAAQVATNYTLTGVISAGSQSVAIISANGAPAKALVLGKELAPGVTVNEVHPRYVMLSDGGVMKRIDLAPDTKAAAPMGGAGGAQAAVPSQPVSVPEPQMDAGAEAGHGDVGVHDQPMPPSPTNPPLNMGPVPQAAPAQPVQQQQPQVQQQQPQIQQQQPQLQQQQIQQQPQQQAPTTMPAPVRSPNNPVVQPPTSR
jgi:general secretion pathway protein C